MIYWPSHCFPISVHQILLSRIITETVASSDIKTMIGAAFGVLHISLQKAKVKDVFCLFVFLFVSQVNTVKIILYIGFTPHRDLK